MAEIRMVPLEKIGFNFVEAPHLPPGGDEYYLRFQQAARPASDYHGLTKDEIEALARNGNTCDDWNNLRVTQEFTPDRVQGCDFRGLVRIGRLDPVYLEHHDLRLPAGLYRSRIISCDLGDNVAIHNVSYLAHYIIGDQAILFNAGEVLATSHAKFGNGIVKDGEPESARVWMDLCNENGGRGVMPFDGMIAADAYLWAKSRDEPALLEHFKAITQKTFDSRRGYYGMIGRQAVIKDSRVIKDVKIGDAACITGANNLENLTVNSSLDEPTQIGEGCELTDGIVGYGCKIFYGVKAVRFVTGRNVQLKYGARLINCYLGDNSTVSCCELLNNLIFPAHEQHHNNSFLCATLVLGQSNVAAGATIGSNHNSRAADGEIVAGRGFWAGLCTSLKHNSRFASFCLLAKGAYPAELDVPLPFSLIANDEAHDRLVIIPAYAFMYNMYALARNSWKFADRDKRVHKVQHVEFDALAPDTVEEMVQARHLLQTWVGRAWCRSHGKPQPPDDEALVTGGNFMLLPRHADAIDQLEILGENSEKSGRKVVILKARQAWNEYGKMIQYYAARTLLAWIEARGLKSFAEVVPSLAGPRLSNWVNLGGQLVMADDLTQLRARMMGCQSWDAIHAEYDRLWARYPADKARHAYAWLLLTCSPTGAASAAAWQEALEHMETGELPASAWRQVFDRAVATGNEIAERTFASRAKDYENPFRKLTFSSDAEMAAVYGPLEDNSFVQQVRAEAADFARRVEAIKKLT
jgi:NDP-sugar pyrophosphorylase family protein